MAEIGIISDTHGLLRPSALAALHGCDHIIHAGDIGSEDVVPELRKIAPVTAVRGNIDKDEWAQAFAEEEVLRVGSTFIYVIHSVNDLDLDPVAGGFGVVVSGHSHKPSVEALDGVLYVNPGSAGPRRFSLPIAVARLSLGADGPEASVIELSA